MRLLLDTHTFLWFLLDDPKLSPTARALVVDPSNDIEVSPATYWEIAIKMSLGKYALPEPYDLFIEREWMHQGQHRHVSQEMLDLKHLYWNCRVFREGKRKGRRPYELLGLKLPPSDWWKLLQMDLKELEQALLTQ